MSDPRYPIGKIELPGALTPAARAAGDRQPSPASRTQLHDVVRGLDQAQLDTPYRDGGWTLRQVVHHIADSHVNAYVRHKLTITEKTPPPIKAYDENEWARLADANGADRHVAAAGAGDPRALGALPAHAACG